MKRSLPPILVLVIRLCAHDGAPRRTERGMPPWCSTPGEPEPDAEPEDDLDDATWTVGDIAAATGATPRAVLAVARALGFEALVFDAEQAALILSALDGSTPPRAA